MMVCCLYLCFLDYYPKVESFLFFKKKFHSSKLMIVTDGILLINFSNGLMCCSLYYDAVCLDGVLFSSLNASLEYPRYFFPVSFGDFSVISPASVGSAPQLWSLVSFLSVHSRRSHPAFWL